MKKKLLILVSHLSFFISHRLEIAVASKDMGYELKVVFGELDADLKILNDLGIDYLHLPIQRGGTNFLQDIKSMYFIWKLFRKVRPDILHLVTIKPYLYGGIIARLTNVKCVVSAVSGLGSLFIHKNFKSKLIRLFLYPIYKFALNHRNQYVIFQNEEDSNVLVRWGVLNSNKIKLIKGSGVKIEEFTQLNETEGIPTVCFAARLLKDKGVYEFVLAAELLKKKGIIARFILAGDIDKKNPSSLSLQELNKLKDNKNIEVLGYHQNIKELYKKSHIVCLPSYREGLPKSLIEAAAACRAIVTTDVPGCRDAIIPNVSGLLVPLNDSKKLADAIEWLILNPKERILMGKAGRKLAISEFNIDKVIKKHLLIYDELLKTIKN